MAALPQRTQPLAYFLIRVGLARLLRLAFAVFDALPERQRQLLNKQQF